MADLDVYKHANLFSSSGFHLTSSLSLSLTHSLSHNVSLARFSLLISSTQEYHRTPLTIGNLAFCSAAAKLAEAVLSNPSDESLLDFLALTKVGLTPALKRGEKFKQRLERYPSVDWPEPRRRDGEGGTRSTSTAGSAARILSGTSTLWTKQWSNPFDPSILWAQPTNSDRP